MAKIKSITIIGQRWFDKLNGNTYCACKILINGKHILTSDWTYGYGDFYRQLAGQLLNEKKILSLEAFPGGSLESVSTYCYKNNIDFFSHVSDGLKRELVQFSKELPND